MEFSMTVMLVKLNRACDLQPIATKAVATSKAGTVCLVNMKCQRKRSGKYMQFHQERMVTSLQKTHGQDAFSSSVTGVPCRHWTANKLAIPAVHAYGDNSLPKEEALVVLSESRVG